ncbi:MAG: sugar ABC transporter [Proteobacteria bacterium]|nr:sugar ABC transporter [Pseudomonadota bacterium]MBU1583603.1 sugar ABC transporter [Pseudomonadota bacterium]MBU2455096.1 sugar ABC transporter [Pseudomonadota bacterium]MBU2629893.1 sugar ABC transporter [Pseudomonadota bacterium]
MKKVQCIIMLVAGFLILSGSVALSASTSILIIESYHAEYPWDKSYIQGIREGMKGDYEFFTFEMDTKRIPQSEYEKSAQKAWEYYLEKKPALVFLGDDNALKYLSARFAKEKTPVVFLGINNNPRAYDIFSAVNMTGVLERPLLKRSIVEMDKLLELKKVLILFDSGTTSKVVLSEVFNGKEEMKISDIDIHLKLIGSWETWQETVLNCKNEGYDAMVIGLYHTIVDKTNTHIDAEKVLNWTSKNTPIPPFAFWDFAVGPGKAIGGLTLFGKTQGQAAAEMAIEILKGTQPSKIQVRYGEKGNLLFSRTQLKKYNIDLPEDIASKATLTD